MEKFNHETATVADLCSVLEFANGALEALISNGDPLGAKDEKDNHEHNFFQFHALARRCQSELAERLSNYLALK